MIMAIGILSVLCAGLLIALSVLIYLYRGQSRTIRRQADYIRELLAIQLRKAIRNANIHRVAVPEKTFHKAIEYANEPEETDYNPMFGKF